MVCSGMVNWKGILGITKYVASTTQWVHSSTVCQNCISALEVECTCTLPLMLMLANNTMSILTLALTTHTLHIHTHIYAHTSVITSFK